MKYRRLGKNGLRVSEISYGGWLTIGGSETEEHSIELVKYALEQGINFIDIADVYAQGEAERVMGLVFAEDQYTRKNLVVSSKVFWPMSDDVNDVGLSRKHIMDSITGTLDRLQFDYIDIYYCHRYDWKTPLRETIEAMDDLVRDGRVRYWGTSMWSAAQIERGIGICKEIGARFPSVDQPRYNMLERYIEMELLYTYNMYGIGVTPFSPLAQGVLTGKYNDGIPEGTSASRREFVKYDISEENISKVKKLMKISESLEIPVNQLALAWVLSHKEISSVITGATKIPQIESNVKSVDVNLSNDILSEIEKVLDNKHEIYPNYSPLLMDRP